MGISSLFKTDKPFTVNLKDANGDEMYESTTSGTGEDEITTDTPYSMSFSDPTQSEEVKEITKEYKKRKNPSDASFIRYQIDILTSCITGWVIFDDDSNSIPFEGAKVKDVLTKASTYLRNQLYISINERANFTKGSANS